MLTITTVYSEFTKKISQYIEEKIPVQICLDKFQIETKPGKILEIQEETILFQEFFFGKKIVLKIKDIDAIAELPVKDTEVSEAMEAIAA